MLPCNWRGPDFYCCSQRALQLHRGGGASTMAIPLKLVWKENGLELCIWWDTVSSSKGRKSGIGKQKRPWLIQTPCHNHASRDELVHILEFRWWSTSVLRSGAWFRKASSGPCAFMSLVHTQTGSAYNIICVHFEYLNVYDSVSADPVRLRWQRVNKQNRWSLFPTSLARWLAHNEPQRAVWMACLCVRTLGDMWLFCVVCRSTVICQLIVF